MRVAFSEYASVTEPWLIVFPRSGLTLSQRWKTCGVLDVFAPFSGAIQYTVSFPAGCSESFVASATVAESLAISCAWAATSGEQAVFGSLALICSAHLFMSRVYCST